MRSSNAPKAIQKRYIGDSGIAEHAGAQLHQLNRAQLDKEIIHTPGISVRRHVHPTKTRKDKLAGDHFVESLLISRTAAVLRLAWR